MFPREKNIRDFPLAKSAGEATAAQRRPANEEDNDVSTRTRKSI